MLEAHIHDLDELGGNFVAYLSIRLHKFTENRRSYKLLLVRPDGTTGLLLEGSG